MIEFHSSPLFKKTNVIFPQLKDISWSKYLFYSVLVSLQKQISDVSNCYFLRISIVNLEGKY